ncbi:MAG: class I SAM-dependent methyltransferase [Acidimicrobiia bacterium]|nr:class I SAM-dependent methyltransferase [Acidimicrobiia bacterium]
MRFIGRAWSAAAKLRQRFGEKEDWEAGRLEWVRRNAPGKSFADIGGMFKYVGEIAFMAEEAGATEVTMFDVGDPDIICEGNPEWGWFDKKRADRGSNVRYVQGNLEDPAAVEQIGVHDVVFFSGVLYHTPNPVLQLMQLRAITRELAFISTLTIPEIPGFPQACTFYPYLDPAARRPYAEGYHWASDLLAIGPSTDERPMYGYGNCWWGITRSALVAMLRSARFEVVEERRLPLSPWVTELVVRPLALDPLLPPVTYFRERGEALARGERLPFADWYDRAADR